MEIRLDPEHLRSQIALRRAATEIRVAMSEQLKVHFITRRPQLLSNFSITAGAWMMLLHACVAHGDDKKELESLKAEVVAFKDWAEEQLQEMQRMGLAEAIENNEASMPDDPQLVASLRKLLNIAPRKDPRDRGR